MDDQVQVGGHDDVGVDAKALLAVAERQTLGDYLATCLRDEYGEPFDDGIREIINSCFGVDSVAFHGRDCRDSRRKTLGDG